MEIIFYDSVIAVTLLQQANGLKDWILFHILNLQEFLMTKNLQNCSICWDYGIFYFCNIKECFTSNKYWNVLKFYSDRSKYFLDITKILKYRKRIPKLVKLIKFGCTMYSALSAFEISIVFVQMFTLYLLSITKCVSINIHINTEVTYKVIDTEKWLWIQVYQQIIQLILSY